MHPAYLISLAALHGFLKGKNSTQRVTPYQALGAPLIEETIYRKPVVEGKLSPLLSSLAFAIDHNPKSVARAFDVAAGGFLYSKIAQQSGLLAAVAAHAAHNVALALSTSPHRTRSSPARVVRSACPCEREHELELEDEQGEFEGEQVEQGESESDEQT